MKKTGIEEEDLIEMMKDETWMLGQDAIDNGFATDLIEEEVELVACVDPERFKNTPKDFQITIDIDIGMKS